MENNSVIRHKDASALSQDDRELLGKATEAIGLSYAPYSNFHVGSAVRTEGGHISLGANQENASFPLSICGERVAMFNAAVHHPHERILVCAICAKGQKKLTEPAPPCGACLQVLQELEERQGHPIRLLLKGDSDLIYEVPGISVLMPLRFNWKFL